MENILEDEKMILYRGFFYGVDYEVQVEKKRFLKLKNNRLILLGLMALLLLIVVVKVALLLVL